MGSDKTLMHTGVICPCKNSSQIQLPRNSEKIKTETSGEGRRCTALASAQDTSKTNTKEWREGKRSNSVRREAKVKQQRSFRLYCYTSHIIACCSFFLSDQSSPSRCCTQQEQRNRRRVQTHTATPHTQIPSDPLVCSFYLSFPS
jgi:hypothetical protein